MQKKISFSWKLSDAVFKLNPQVQCTDVEYVGSQVPVFFPHMKN